MGEARIRAWLCGCWLQSRRSIPHGQACSVVPELPDLTVVAEELQRRVTGRTVLEASAPTPILVRATPKEVAALAGSEVAGTRRRGKFLLVTFSRDGADEQILAANPMLAGRF